MFVSFTHFYFSSLQFVIYNFYIRGKEKIVVYVGYLTSSYVKFTCYCSSLESREDSGDTTDGSSRRSSVARQDIMLVV